MSKYAPLTEEAKHQIAIREGKALVDQALARLRRAYHIMMDADGNADLGAFEANIWEMIDSASGEAAKVSIALENYLKDIET